MPRLRELLGQAGLGSAHTVLQSGNIIVWPAEPVNPLHVGHTVSALMATHFQVDVPCLVRTEVELRAVLELNPLEHLSVDDSKYLVTFPLTRQLRELETDGIVHRKVFDQVPPKVEYSLTTRGESLAPLVSQMDQWGQSFINAPAPSTHT